MTLPKYLKEQLDNFENPPTNEEMLEIASQKNAKKRTIITRFSKMKKFIINKFDLTAKQAAQYKPPRDLVDDVIEMDNQKRSNRKNFVITSELLKNIEEHKNDGFLGHLMYTIYCSGRRINEILDDKFKITKVANSPSKVWFSSLSKQSEPRKEKVKLLCDRSDFIQIVRKIRDLRGDQSVSNITRSLNYYLDKYIGELSSHNLRGIYAMILYQMSGRKQNINGFIKDVLNHESSETALNYAKYIFDDNIANDLSNFDIYSEAK